MTRQNIFSSDLPPAQPPAEKKKPTIASVRWHHDAIIDQILHNPAITQNGLCEIFGFTPAWMSIVVNSDAFKNRLAERKGELIDPQITASLEARAAGAASRALDRLIDRLDSPLHGALKTADLVSIAKLGVAPKQTTPPPVQNTLYVVALPAPAQNSQSWLENRSHPTPRGDLPLIQEASRG